MSCGESYFNFVFLLVDIVFVVDLFCFEKGNYQLSGIYWVDIWCNDEFVVMQDICFEVGVVGIGDKFGGLMFCFILEWIKWLGVNIVVFFVLDKGVDIMCIYFFEKILGVEVVFDFVLMCLNISLLQVLLFNSVCGYILLEEWDEGIFVVFINYSFIGSCGIDSDSYFLSLLSGLNYGFWWLCNNGVWNYLKGDGYYL